MENSETKLICHLVGGWLKTPGKSKKREIMLVLVVTMFAWQPYCNASIRNLFRDTIDKDSARKVRRQHYMS